MHIVLITKDFANSGYLSSKGWIPTEYRAYCETPNCNWRGPNHRNMKDCEIDRANHSNETN